MQFSVDRTTLLKALNHVQSVVERRGTIPILSNILIRADEDGVRLVATDLDIEIVEAMDASVTRSGGTTAPAHTFYDVVRKLPDGAEVTIEAATGEPRMTLKAGRSEFTLPCISADEFPVLNAEGFVCEFEIGPKELARLIDKTRFAISTEETRYYLNGIHFHPVTEGEPALRAVATDGHRLALAENALPEGAAAMPAIIIPRKAIAELRRLIDDTTDNIKVRASESKIRFDLGPAILTSKLIDGAFPDYARVIPKNNQRVLRATNDAFAEAVGRVSILSAEKSRSIKLSLNDDQLTLIVNNPETGKAEEDMAVEYRDVAIEIGFNARYLLDVTGQIEGEEIELHLNDSSAPALILDTGDARARYVLMPLRV
jgi:DNA polymerase III subunit beta